MTTPPTEGRVRRDRRWRARGGTPVFALPPVPLSDDFFMWLAADDDIEQLWVPTVRPAAVTTRAGVHQGDILKL